LCVTYLICSSQEQLAPTYNHHWLWPTVYRQRTR